MLRRSASRSPLISPALTKNHESPTWVPDSGNVVANTGSVTLEPQAGTANTYAFNLANGKT